MLSCFNHWNSSSQLLRALRIIRKSLNYQELPQSLECLLMNSPIWAESALINVPNTSTQNSSQHERNWNPLNFSTRFERCNDSLLAIRGDGLIKSKEKCRRKEWDEDENFIEALESARGRWSLIYRWFSVDDSFFSNEFLDWGGRRRHLWSRSFECKTGNISFLWINFP